VIDSVLLIAGFTTGMILGLFLLARMSRPVGSGPALAGLVVGFLTVLTIWLLTPLAWPWYPLVGTLSTVAVALLLDRLGLFHGPSPDRSAQS
jgi:Na+/proline symporter